MAAEPGEVPCSGCVNVHAGCVAAGWAPKERPGHLTKKGGKNKEKNPKPIVFLDEQPCATPPSRTVGQRPADLESGASGNVSSASPPLLVPLIRLLHVTFFNVKKSL